MNKGWDFLQGRGGTVHTKQKAHGTHAMKSVSTRLMGGGLEQLQHTGSKEQECATRRESGVGSQFKVGTVNLC